MSQVTVQSAPNSGGSTYRANMNNIVGALFSSNSGSAAPSPTVAGMFWLDTGVSPPVMRQRNTANTAWIVNTPETVAALTLWGNSGGAAAAMAEISMATLRTMMGFSQVTSSPRRITLPGGMIIQGGTGNTGAVGATLTFPLSFSAAPTFVATPAAAAGSMVIYNNLLAGSVAVSGWSSNTVNANLNYTWLAFGE